MTENLKYNVAQLLKGRLGATRTADIQIPLEYLAPELSWPEDVPTGELSGSIRMMLVCDGILVQGHLAAQATLSCVRCLAPVTVPLAVDVEEIFTPTTDILTGKSVMPEEDDQALWIDGQHILDLREVLRQDLLLALPGHVLCRDDCKGLCPICGQDLNQGSCDCQPEPDPRWSALSALLKDSE